MKGRGGLRWRVKGGRRLAKRDAEHQGERLLGRGPRRGSDGLSQPDSESADDGCKWAIGQSEQDTIREWSESQAGREPGRQALIELLRSSRASGLARVPDVSACCPGPKTQHCSPCRSISSKPPLSQALILVHLPKMAIFPRSAAKLVPLVLLGVVRVQYIEPAAPCAAG